MWGATISVFITAAGVLYLEGPIAALTLAALGSAALLAALRYLQTETPCESARRIEIINGARRPFSLAALQRKAS